MTERKGFPPFVLDSILSRPSPQLPPHGMSWHHGLSLGHCSHLHCGLPGSTLAPSASGPSSTLHQGQPLKDTKLVVFFLCLKSFRPLGHKTSSQALRAIRICYLTSFPIVPWVPSHLLFTPHLHIPHVHLNQTMWISLEGFLCLTVFMSACLEHLLTCPWGEMFKIESSPLRSLPVLSSAPPSTHRMNHSAYTYPCVSPLPVSFLTMREPFLHSQDSARGSPHQHHSP